MLRILRVFFAACGPSFTRGVTIVRAGGEPIIRTAVFSGFLADEKAHNQIMGSKGASGTRPCPTCSNCFGRMREDSVPDGSVHYKTTDFAKFKAHTNESLYLCYDTVCAAAPDTRQRVSQLLGLNMNEDGLLHDRAMRHIYHPADHTIRDHQHVLTSDGVANKQLAQLMRVLLQSRVSIAMVQQYVTAVKLPHCHGKTDAHWISKKRLGKKMESLASFSGVVLSLVPIVLMFLLETVVDDASPIRPHVDCLTTLWHILGLVMLGPVDAMAHVDLLRALISRHAEQYTNLYPSSQTPKFHQLFHIPDNALFVGRLLSCFVLERKHRTTKRAALFVFRYIEGTVIKDLVNRQCEAVAGRESLFLERYIVTPRKLVLSASVTMYHGKQAVLPCGSVRSGDVVCISSGECGEIVGFWRAAGSPTIVVRMSMFRPSPSGSYRWLVADPTSHVTDSAEILAPVIWRRIGDNEIRVMPPFRLVLRDSYGRV